MKLLGCDRIGILLRREARAVDLYADLLGRVPSGTVAEVLRRLLAGHRFAQESLGGRTHAEVPDPHPPWHGGDGHAGDGHAGDGHADDAHADVPGNDGTASRPEAFRAAIHALRNAEEACLDGYSDALAEGSLPASDRMLLLSVLLPEQRSHDALLNRIDDLT